MYNLNTQLVPNPNSGQLTFTFRKRQTDYLLILQKSLAETAVRNLNFPSVTAGLLIIKSLSLTSDWKTLE